jgi:hypothetical protein
VMVVCPYTIYRTLPQQYLCNSIAIAIGSLSRHLEITSRYILSTGHTNNILYYNFDLIMVFNVTFNKISVISRRSVLLVEETRVPEEHHRPIASHWQTLSQNVIFIFIHISLNVPNKPKC